MTDSDHAMAADESLPQFMIGIRLVTALGERPPQTLYSL